MRHPPQTKNHSHRRCSATFAFFNGEVIRPRSQFQSSRKMEAETSPSAGIGANLIGGSSLHSHFQNFSFFSSFLFSLFCGFSLSTASNSRHLLLPPPKSEARPASETEAWQGERAKKKNSKQFHTASDPPGLHPVKDFALRFIYTTLRPFKKKKKSSKSTSSLNAINFLPHPFSVTENRGTPRPRTCRRRVGRLTLTPAHTCLDTRHKPRPLIRARGAPSLTRRPTTTVTW